MSRKRLLRLEELESRCLLSNAVFHTRSIVAADPATGQVGMAVVSFPTGVPAVVPVGEPGVIVANQSTPSYATAQAIIAGIHAGEDAPTALANAVAADPTRANRQLGVAALAPDSPTGVTVATYTGSFASPQSCGFTGDVYAVQANLQTSDQVCQAMADGFEKAQGSLARRLLAAMEAGSAVGGDQRGEYSATLRVFSNRWEFASYTPIAVSANVDRSSDWFSDLKFGTDAYLSFWTRGDQADRVELTKDRALGIQEALQGLGYFQGDVNGNWMPDSEQALRDFSQRNLAFFRFTTVEQGVRYIDGPLADHIVQGYARGVFRPAPGGAPAPGDSNAVFHTRSIVAADPATGQVGMAVVSFPTGVPAVVPVGEAGVIIANQSTPSYATAQAIIAGIHAGEDAPTALANAVAADPTRANRQLGVAALSDKSPTGVTVATYTGSSASLQRCGLTGDVYAVQANLQTSDQVCQAMADGFEKAQGSLARRLLAAMEAGSAVGGDQRGEYSATLRVFSNRWEFASYTPIAVSANVDRSSDWFSDLKFGTDAYLSFWTRGDQADRVELTKDRALGIQEALQGLGYFQGDVSGNWMPDSEQALREFCRYNLAFFRFTTVEQGVRYIDGPLADHIVQGYARGVFRPAPGGAPVSNGGSRLAFLIDQLFAARILSAGKISSLAEATMEFSFQENAGNWQITNPIGLIARDRLITTSDEMQISREHRTTSVRFGSLRADNPVVVDGVLAHLSLVDL